MADDTTASAAPPAETREERVEREKAKLVGAVAAGKLDHLQERVAWLLNHFPETRDSDITLQLRYWEHFESELFGGGYIEAKDLYQLTRLTSLTRSRATIQNTYALYKASPEIQLHRGTLSEEEKERARAATPVPPTLSVFADESKSGDHLIVGSVWLLHAPEVITVVNRIHRWKEERKFDKEFHFKAITAAKLTHYMEFADFLADNSAVMSFKAISVDGRGHARKDDALLDLSYHLLVAGVRHEHDTARAALPRRLLLTIDETEVGRDRLFLANLRERLERASEAAFGNDLQVDTLAAMPSDTSALLQVADLFTSSLNRVLNSPGGRSHKDEFARHLLDALGMPEGPPTEERLGDMTVHISL